MGAKDILFIGVFIAMCLLALAFLGSTGRGTTTVAQEKAKVEVVKNAEGQVEYNIYTIKGHEYIRFGSTGVLHSASCPAEKK